MVCATFPVICHGPTEACPSGGFGECVGLSAAIDVLPTTMVSATRTVETERQVWFIGGPRYRRRTFPQRQTSGKRGKRAANVEGLSDIHPANRKRSADSGRFDLT